MKRIILIFMCIILVSSCSVTGSSDFVQKSDYLLGTFISLKIYDSGPEYDEIIDDCFSIIAEYEQIFSFTDTDSELSVLNASAFNYPVPVSNKLFDVVSESLYYCDRTNGAFDIGLGRLISIWDNSFASSIPPETDEISDYIGFKGYKNIVIDADKKTIMYTDERVAIHLGACAKGYVEDRIAEYLKEKGVKSAVLDFGGSITVLGDKKGSPFNIGITDPYNENAIIGTIGVVDSCVVTSGDYRRFFVYDDVRYHHIIDSDTAYPSMSDINGVSVICESAFKGDCLSTAAFVLGSEAAASLLDDEGYGYVIITDGSVKISGVVLE